MCTVDWTSDELERIEWMLKHDYKVNFMIDNLPGLYFNEEEESIEVGFPLGTNMVLFNIFYHL